MKMNIFLACVALFGTVPAFAEQVMVDPGSDVVISQVSDLQNQWAHIKYEVPDDKDKLSEIHALENKAGKLTEEFQNRAEPKIWEAIILSTDAGIVKGISALPKVNKAKELLEQAEKIDSNALNGSAHTSLGSLYYQVPGWPIGFGNDKLAEEHLKMALKINPNGIDPNYFYGDFLLHKGHKEQAAMYLKKALEAPPRQGREVADTGRREEIKADLAKI